MANHRLFFWNKIVKNHDFFLVSLTLVSFAYNFALVQQIKKAHWKEDLLNFCLKIDFVKIWLEFVIWLQFKKNTRFCMKNQSNLKLFKFNKIDVFSTQFLMLIMNLKSDLWFLALKSKNVCFKVFHTEWKIVFRKFFDFESKRSKIWLQIRDSITIF